MTMLPKRDLAGESLALWAHYPDMGKLILPQHP
jgi:hypothetical protein